MIASAGLWITIGVLAAILLATAATSFMLLAMGRISLDLGWGRSVHPLGPITTTIEAPRDVVAEMISAPYLGRTPSGTGIEVLARDQRLAVAAHHSRVHFYDARTVEVVAFELPDRVRFRHLTGPVPHALEEFTLIEDGDATTLVYSGEVGIDFFILGRLAGRHWVVPQWERVVREHLDDLKMRAEQRARRHAGSDDSTSSADP